MAFSNSKPLLVPSPLMHAVRPMMEKGPDPPAGEESL